MEILPRNLLGMVTLHYYIAQSQRSSPFLHP